MRGKQGSHVGMILSFVIFITFVVFLYTVVSPAVNTGESKKTILETIKIEVERNISTDLTTAVIQIVSSKNPNQNCVKLTNLLTLLAIPPNSSGNYPLIVKNETENIQLAYTIDMIADLQINRNNKSNRFFKIYSAPQFSGLPISTIDPCSSVTDYNVSSITIDSYSIERKIYQFIDNYKNDYNGLKTILKVPPGSEFGFSFKQANGTIISVGNTTGTVSVYADETPIQYVNNSANILSGFINIRVW